jgi:outer membrane receptor protein involved in Fe transport
MQLSSFRQTSFKVNKTHQLISLALLTFCINAYAEPLNTTLPITIDLPMQPLAESLKQFSKKSGLSIAVDSELVKDKMAPAVKGNYESNEALRKLLNDSGLEVNMEGTTAIIKRERIVPTKTEAIQLDQVQVRAKRFYEIGPLPGLGLTKEQIPGNVQSITAKEIKESHSLSITDLMNKKLQSVNVNDYQGNPFQMDVTYRGFTAGPQIGTPQGLSVFFDGIRVNEPFGDVVNWDMIPMNALASVDVFPGSNPIFGLNTLGGAFTVKTKDGFSDPGVDAEVLTGSYGRKQLQVEGGINNGTFALFGAGNFFLEDGWRENSPSKVNQLFGKASYRGDKLDLSLSTLLVQTDLVGNGLLPSEMYAQDRNGSFTSEDTTKNRLQQYQLSSSYFVNDTFTITGQLYRRNSDRKQKGADVYTEFGDKLKNRNLNPGEEYACVYNSTGRAAEYGLPNYYVLDIPEPSWDSLGFSNEFLLDYFIQDSSTATPNYSLSNGAFGAPPVGDSFNRELPPEFLAIAKTNFDFWKNFDQSNYGTVRNDASDQYGTSPAGNGDYFYNFNAVVFNNIFAEGSEYVNGLPTNPNSDINPLAGADFYYYSVDSDGNNPVKHVVVFLKPDNADNCNATQATYSGGNREFLTELDPITHQIIRVDGLYQDGGTATGVVEGTPTAVINDGRITQVTDGASVQLNWNIPKHKFMVGASIDSSKAEYANEQMLGMLDASRNAFLAPDLIRDEYAAKIIGVRNNDFSGSNITKSIYASETWSPIDSLHLTGAMRYNDTKANIKLATRRLGDQFNDISNFYAAPDKYGIAVNGVRPPTGYKIPEFSKVLSPAEKESHTYYSLNPSLGVSWQAQENLNLYGNWAKGTRTPSVIELGCAFDHTLIDFGPLDSANPNGPRKLIEKSIAENRSCALPTTLSGDPHLPQIKATTYDVGLRGTLAGILGADSIEWNLGAYRTDLKDDIYMITFPGNQSFFDTIGNTRRQGIEAGMTADFGRTKLRLNYALTDATFQSTFDMAADDNSSATRPVNGQYCNSAGTCTYSDPEDDVGRIRVKPGNRMPGVPLHNLNATLSYEITPKWLVGLTAVAHSDAFLRGNENNKHEKGKAIMVTVPTYDASGAFDGGFRQVARQPSTNPGKVAGYATFNFQTSYQLAPEWTATLLVNNLLDKEYFSAGRLGRNPFSPSINGAIGPDGYNHNSNDWLSTNFVSPSAPRGIWFSLNWQFVPDKK